MPPPPNKPFKIPDKPAESPGDGKIWKYIPKCNKWVTAPAPTTVKTASPALTLGSTGLTLVMDEIAAYHQRQNDKRTPPPFFTPTAPGMPKISNKITPSPTVLQDLNGGYPKVTTKAGVTDINSKSDPSQAKDTIMTPSPAKKKHGEDDLSEMTVSPSRLASPTKLSITALEDAALDKTTFQPSLTMMATKRRRKQTILIVVRTIRSNLANRVQTVRLHLASPIQTIRTHLPNRMHTSRTHLANSIQKVSKMSSIQFDHIGLFHMLTDFSLSNYLFVGTCVKYMVR